MQNFRMAAIYSLMFVSVCAAAAYGQDYKTKTFNVNRNGHVLIDINYGDITIKTWDKNQVAVRYEDNYDEDEESFLVQSAGNHVRVRSSNSNYSDVEVTIPSQFYVEMRTEAGDLKIPGSFSGSMQGTTSGGDIVIGKISGFIDLHTYGGDIKGDEIKGEMKILTYGGDIELSNVDGNGDISTSGGNIKINRVSKSISINTAGGNISANEINGKIKLNTGGGNINVGNISGDADLKSGGGNIKSSSLKGSLSSSTGSGNIYLYKVDGSVKAVSGGGDILAEFSGNNPEASQIKTNSGKIKLILSDNAKVNVEARIRGVGSYYDFNEKDYIKCELNPSGKTINKNSDNILANYTFNGGGKKVYLDTSYGEIEIKRLQK